MMGGKTGLNKLLKLFIADVYKFQAAFSWATKKKFSHEVF